MNLVRVQDDRYTFQLGPRDRALLADVLRQFPSIPPGYHRLSRSPNPAADAGGQALLEEFIAAEKKQHKGRIDRLLKTLERSAPAPSGPRTLTLEREDLEWLLQVLNDVRVGSWIRLGCPDNEDDDRPRLAKAQVPTLVTLEVAGYFECAILDALDRPSGPRPGSSK